MSNRGASDDEMLSFRTPLMAGMLVVLGALSLLPLGSDFWLDETGTVWTVAGGFADAIDRSIRVQLQGPLYAIVAWVARQVLGTSEIAMRVPSTLAAIGAVLVFARLATRVVGAHGARAATVVFAATEGVMFAAGDARPYAFALCASLGASLALVAWVQERGNARLAAFVLLTAATVYFQYVFAVTLVPQIVYLSAARRTLAGRARPLTVAALALSALLVPAVVHLWWTANLPQALVSPPEDISLAAFARRLVPPTIVAGAVGGFAVAFLEGRPRMLGRAEEPMPSASRALVAAMAFLPTIAIYAASLIVSPKFFVARYLLTAAPGLALLAGWLIGRVRPVRAHRFVLAGVVFAAVLGSGGRYHTTEHWREAAAIERAFVDDSSTMVLFHGGFVEAKVPSWLTDPYKRSFLLAPATAYRFDGALVAMPYDLSAETRPYLTDLVARLGTQRSFVLVTPYPWIRFRRWLDEQLRPAGFRSRLIGYGGVIELYAFERTA